MDITSCENKVPSINDYIGKIICADCMDILKQLPDKCVDLVLTDPPYTWREAGGGGFSKNRPIYKEIAKFCTEDWYTDEFLSLLISKCKFPNLVICGSRVDIVKILSFAERHNLLYAILPICKKNPIPFTNNTWLNNEYIFHLTDRQIDYCKNYRFKIPYFLVDNTKETNHPNEKKIECIERILNNITREGDLVLDCFSGSGTTAIACHGLKRRFICIEKDPEYWAASVKRLEEEQKQGVLF